MPTLIVDRKGGTGIYISASGSKQNVTFTRNNVGGCDIIDFELNDAPKGQDGRACPHWSKKPSEQVLITTAVRSALASAETLLGGEGAAKRLKISPTTLKRFVMGHLTMIHKDLASAAVELEIELAS